MSYDPDEHDGYGGIFLLQMPPWAVENSEPLGQG
jgi:hypothetical protein